MLNLIDKITIHCPESMNNKKFSSDYDEIAEQCKALLAYPHSWVRLRAVKILGTILSAINVEELNKTSRENECERGFIFDDTENCIKSLVLDLCAQYTPNVSQDMADQVCNRYLSIFLNYFYFKIAVLIIHEYVVNLSIVYDDLILCW